MTALAASLADRFVFFAAIEASSSASDQTKTFPFTAAPTPGVLGTDEGMKEDMGLTDNQAKAVI